jgi:hypothetical protein
MAHVYRACDVHEGVLVTGGQGACHNCSSYIGNSSFMICEPCSIRLNACIVCRQPATKTVGDEEEVDEKDKLNHRQLVERLKDWKYPRVKLPMVVEWSASASVRNYLTSENIKWETMSKTTDRDDCLFVDIAVADLARLSPINPRTTYFQMPDLWTFLKDI